MHQYAPAIVQMHETINVRMHEVMYKVATAARMNMHERPNKRPGMMCSPAALLAMHQHAPVQSSALKAHCLALLIWLVDTSAVSLSRPSRPRKGSWLAASMPSSSACSHDGTPFSAAQSVL